jgi:histidine triad (HIT) family protein
LIEGNSIKDNPNFKPLKGMITMDDCVFCQIIQRKMPANIVYEDNKVMAFLSHRPVNEGHTLVVPKKHYVDIYEAPEEEVAYLFTVVKRLTHAVKDAIGTSAIRIVQNNSKNAGQVVFHMHVHIIPMKEGNHIWRENDFRSTELLEKDAREIRQKIK